MVGRWRQALRGATVPASARPVSKSLRIVSYWRILGTNQIAGQYGRLGGTNH